ncbi:hypothetical protein QBC36DRAFT_125884 [Triangularia setosa]|uniref:Uncharacterized protein n=1 Tax=Triangularia setosa TaxID=2587417 RepID=A0AAN6WCQ5_9PEZI|nr:hypothetical protein QBC36DRAFT_125884 [Podospora setosa]
MKAVAVVVSFAVQHESPIKAEIICCQSQSQIKNETYTLFWSRNMSFSPLPSQLCLLSSLPQKDVGDKVRFLGW